MGKNYKNAIKIAKANKHWPRLNFRQLSDEAFTLTGCYFTITFDCRDEEVTVSTNAVDDVRFTELKAEQVEVFAANERLQPLMHLVIFDHLKEEEH